MLYKILLPLASLDIIPPEISSDLLFSFSDDLDKPYSAHLEEMGYDNHNAIQNIGSVFYFIAFTIILMVFSLLLSPFKCGFCTMIKRKLRIIGLLATLYMFFFEGYLEILISCYLSNEGAVTKNADDEFSYFISVVFPIILFTVVPIMHIYVLNKPKEER
jgi:hypothetical protein